MYRYCAGLIYIADLEIALNYGQATGAAQLLRFVTEHTEVSPMPSSKRL
jgi:hypothetical protein